MFYLTRRQVHAVLAGAAAAATYLGVAEMGSKRPVRTGSLWVLASMAMAGMAGQALSNKASVKANVTEARLNNFFNNGGSVGGDFQVNGQHTVTGPSLLQDTHVGGTLYGIGGTLGISGITDTNNNINGGGNITVSGTVNGVSANVSNMYHTSAGSFAGLDSVCNDMADRLNQVINRL